MGKFWAAIALAMLVVESAPSYAEPALNAVERYNVEAIQGEERARGGPVRWR